MPVSSLAPQGLVDLSAGAELAQALERLDVDALRGLEDSPLVDVIIAAERQIAHLQALQVRATVELSRRENYAFCGGCDDAAENSLGHEHNAVRAVGSELSAALSWTPHQADAVAGLATELVEELPDTLAALDTGQIDLRRARLIADKTRVLGPAARQRVERGVLPAAGQKTTTQLGRALDRQVICADPAAAERRRQRGRADRCVVPPRPCGDADGMAELVLSGPAEDLDALYRAVDAAASAARLAGKAHGDSRTLDQHRFDLLTGLGWNAITTGHLGCCAAECGGGLRLAQRRRRPAVVQVTVPVTALAGSDDEPAHLEGFGPIPAQAARAIAADATLRRLITDPRDGRLLEYGNTTYAPPQALADFIVARDRTCRFPTATTPARCCDLDHRVPFQRGGNTGAANMQALSRRFHIDKTLHRWRLHRSHEGSLTWTSPAGRTYRTPAESIGPVHDPPERPPF